MLIDRITNACVPDYDGPCDLHLEGGKIARIEQTGRHGVEDHAKEAGHSLAAEGRVVLPAFVDAHVHLDKAFLLTLCQAKGPTPPHLNAAIATVAALRGTIDPDTVLASAKRAAETLVRHGVTAARAHVEIDVAVGLDLLEMHRSLAAVFADRLELQLVAFPQRGLEMPGANELFGQAMAEGLNVVGGCPYVDSNPRRNLDRVFDLAEQN
jgi:cytosine deaminase